MRKLITCITALCVLFMCPAALAQTYESTLGYSLSYDAERFSCESDGQVDLYRWLDAASNAPSCFMSVCVLTEYTMRDAMDGLKLQAGYDGENGSATISGVNAETFRYYEGSAWNSRVCEYACVPMANNEILLIETNWFLEAEEGVGQKLLDMRSMISLTARHTPRMAQCDTCGGWYEEGNVYRNHLCVGKSYSSSIVATANVNLRTGAGLDYDIVTSVDKGTLLAYQNETTIDERGRMWYRVFYNQKDVWVSAKYAKPAEHTEPPVTGNDIYVITSANVHLREGPGLGYAVIATVSAGREFPYVARETDTRGTVWYQVEYKGGAAWISSKYSRIPC